MGNISNAATLLAVAFSQISWALIQSSDSTYSGLTYHFLISMTTSPHLSSITCFGKVYTEGVDLRACVQTVPTTLNYPNIISLLTIELFSPVPYAYSRIANRILLVNSSKTTWRPMHSSIYCPQRSCSGIVQHDLSKCCSVDPNDVQLANTVPTSRISAIDKYQQSSV